MYTLVAYSPFMSEPWNLIRHPASPRLSRFSSLNLGSWRTGSFRTKSTDHNSVGNGSPRISSFRQSDSFNSKNSTSITTSSNITKTSNHNTNTSSINRKNSSLTPTTTTTTTKAASRGVQKEHSTVHRNTISESPLNSSDSSIDEDEDLYEFDIYEDERRYRPILKRTSKYGALPIPASSKSRGLWKIFSSHRKPHVIGSPPSATSAISPLVGLPASSPKAQCPAPGVSFASSTGKGYESPVPGSSTDLHEDHSSDAGYSSDEGLIGDLDWNHFQLMQSMEKEKRNVHFSDPLVTHIYRHSYKSYIPRDAALVTMKL